mmetsp:Transcript_33647/g.88511  ORF Transcript_33647/g.88511 Transcript_33647/m.88511 type:complete len:110 (-) Transcript_33647:21-350(-)
MPNDEAVAAAAVTHARWATHAALELPEPHALEPHALAAHATARELAASLPTLSVCASEHIDSLLLFLLAVAVCFGAVFVVMHRAVAREMGRSHGRVGVKTTPAKGVHEL